MNFGYLPDPKDDRDFRASVALSIKEVKEMPLYVNLSSYDFPIRDQKGLGCCVSMACTNLRYALLKKQVEALAGDTDLPLLSVLYHYYRCREIMGTIERDSGTYIRTGMKALADWGCAPEKYMPYMPEKFREAPIEWMDWAAGNLKIYTYNRLETFEEMRQSIAQGFPVILAVKVFDNMHGGLVPETIPDGIWKLPEDNNSLIGWHAIVIAGYTTAFKVPGGGWFYVVNSWGKDWGKSGCAWMPYKFILDGHWQDAWMGIA